MNFKRLTIVAMAAIAMTTANAKDGLQKVYMYGFAASFNDSTVYFTDIQKVDSAWINKSDFLYSRDNYSYQLRDYLAEKGIPNATCVIGWALKRKKVEKKYQKFLKRYTKRVKKGISYNVKYLTASDFSFSGITPDEEYIKGQNRKLTKEEKKAAKEARKKKQQDENGKRPPMGGKPGGMPGGMSGGGPR